LASERYTIRGVQIQAVVVIHLYNFCMDVHVPKEYRGYVLKSKTFDNWSGNLGEGVRILLKKKNSRVVH